MLSKKKIQISADVHNLEQVLSLVESIAQEALNVPKHAVELAIAVEEMFTNICMHAYAGAPGCVCVSCSVPAAGVVRVVLTDKGCAFDPTKASKPNIGLSAEEMQPGGLGIFLAKQLVTKMTYERNNNENKIVLIKEG